MSLKESRPVSTGADEDLGKIYEVLDHGYVRLVDYMGNDQVVIDAATKLFGKTCDLETNILVKCFEKHEMAPFRFASLTFQIVLPLYVMAQLVRHRSANLNSFSARYSVFEDKFYLPAMSDMRAQSAFNKQVGHGDIINSLSEQMSKDISAISAYSYEMYQSLIERGLCRELSRMVIPQNIFTKIFWKLDLESMFHFIKLRSASDAQYEIQQYSNAIAKCVEHCFPLSWMAFDGFSCSKVKFSRLELMLIDRLC